MITATKPTAKRIDINEHILSHLDDLNISHLAKKPLCFARGLPFYTCIDPAKDIYTKETKDGKTVIVECIFDFEKDKIIETPIAASK